MKVIRILDVLLEYVFIFIFASCLVAGVFEWKYFIVAGAALLCYFIWGIWRLRCPWCRHPIELDKLLLGRRKKCHCPACGHEITVVFKVNRGLPKRAAERKAMREEPERAGAGYMANEQPFIPRSGAPEMPFEAQTPFEAEAAPEPEPESRPDTSPETEIPETEIPETEAPETEAPETEALEEKAPEPRPESEILPEEADLIKEAKRAFEVWPEEFEKPDMDDVAKIGPFDGGPENLTEGSDNQ